VEKEPQINTDFHRLDFCHRGHRGGFGGAAHLVGKSSKPLLQTSLCVGLERLFPRSLTSAAKPQGITAAFEIRPERLVPADRHPLITAKGIAYKGEKDGEKGLINLELRI